MFLNTKHRDSELAPCWIREHVPGKNFETLRAGAVHGNAIPPETQSSDFCSLHVHPGCCLLQSSQLDVGKSVYFFVVWSFLLFGLFGCYFFYCLGGGVFFLLFGRGPRPRPNSKKNTPPPKQQKKKKKKKHAPAPSERVFFAVWAGGVFFFLLFGRGRVLFFAVWAGGVFFFLLFGPGACFLLLFGRGTGVHSLTRLPGSSLSDPTTKETEQQKKTRVPLRRPGATPADIKECIHLLSQT